MVQISGINSPVDVGSLDRVLYIVTSQDLGQKKRVAFWTSNGSPYFRQRYVLRKGFPRYSPMTWGWSVFWPSIHINPTSGRGLDFLRIYQNHFFWLGCTPVTLTKITWQANSLSGKLVPHSDHVVCFSNISIVTGREICSCRKSRFYLVLAGFRWKKLKDVRFGGSGRNPYSSDARGGYSKARWKSKFLTILLGWGVCMQLVFV